MREVILPAYSTNQKYFINAPVTSKQILIMVYEVNQTLNTFSCSLKRNDLIIDKLNVSAKTLKFVNFANYICYNYDKLADGWIYDSTKTFEILNLPLIIDEESNKEVPTPARIEETDNHIEISRKLFIDIPFPRRMMILLHEYSHNFLNNNPDSETEADINGLNIYLQMGFPCIESVYAFTQILETATKVN
jgi:hypothetical protein